MYLTTRKIRLSETDATGVLYFMNQLKFATEAFEEFLETEFRDLATELYHGEVLMPIVDVRSRYLAPLFLNDQISIHLHFAGLRNTSFEVHTDIKKDGKKIGETMVKHVLMNKETRKRAIIPDDFNEVLNKFGVTEVTAK